MYSLTCKLDVFKPVTLKYTFVYKHKLFVGKFNFFFGIPYFAFYVLIIYLFLVTLENNRHVFRQKKYFQTSKLKELSFLLF